MNFNYKQSQIGQRDKQQQKCFYVLDPLTSDCRKILFQNCSTQNNKAVPIYQNHTQKNISHVEKDDMDPLPEMNFAPFDISQLFGN